MTTPTVPECDRPTIPVPSTEITQAYEAMLALARKRNRRRKCPSPVPASCDRPTMRLLEVVR